MEEHLVKDYIQDIKDDAFHYTYPNEIEEINTDQQKLSLGIISDIHLHPIQPRQVERTAHALNNFAAQDVDVLVINGDVTESGAEVEFAEWHKVLEKIDIKDSRLIVTMGNHELARRDTKDLFIKHYKQVPDYHYKINGYHVIKCSPDGDISRSEYGNVEGWLKDQLAIAKNDTGDLPIFVFFHHPIKDTYYSTREEDGYWGNMKKEVFEDYPMVITFSGHNHAPSNHPQAVWQDRFTAVNLPSMYYAEGPMHVGATTYYKGTHDAAQGIIVEAEGTKIKIRVYNFYNESFANHVFSFDTKDPSTYVYNDSRFDQSVAPQFAEDSILNVERSGETVTIEFKQAHLDKENDLMDFVYKYEFVLIDEKGEQVHTSSEWAEWLKDPQPDTLVKTIDEMDSLKNYTLEIYPYNAFGKKGQALSVKI